MTRLTNFLSSSTLKLNNYKRLQESRVRRIIQTIKFCLTSTFKTMCIFITEISLKMTRSDLQPLIDVVLHVDDSYRDTTLKMKTYVHFHICY